MPGVADRATAQTAIQTDLAAIFISFDWLITSLSPGSGEKMSKHSVRAGDVAALLARFSEFQRVTEALRCAVDFQERMARRNRDMPASRALLYRIGVSLGDVIVDESDIFGDGVNVAARLA